MDIFSVKDFSATTGLMILKFGTKLDSDDLYCVTKTATYCLSVPLFVTIATVKVESIPEFYFLAIALINYLKETTEKQLLFFGLIGGQNSLLMHVPLLFTPSGRQSTLCK